MVNLKQLRKKNIKEIKRMLAMGFTGEDYNMIMKVYNEKRVRETNAKCAKGTPCSP